MNTRLIQVRIHAVAGMLAMTTIAAFWFSTVIS